MTRDCDSSSPRRLGRVVACSAVMGEVFAILERLAPIDGALTLIGEPGTGKKALARGVHELSPRHAMPFVVLDCAAMSGGAADRALPGRASGALPASDPLGAPFSRANGGTLYLDEVGSLSPDAQGRVLAALDSRRARDGGHPRDGTFDLRVIAGSTRDLAPEVDGGRFRADLYFRLASALVHVPPLRERPEDLPLLVAELLSDLGHSEVAVEEGTWEALRGEPWPQNVRELKRALAKALEITDRGVLEPRHVREARATDDEVLAELPLAGKRLDRIERVAIKLTLAHCGGNKVHAARALGIAVSTLYEKLRKYELT